MLRRDFYRFTFQFDAYERKREREVLRDTCVGFSGVSATIPRNIRSEQGKVLDAARGETCVGLNVCVTGLHDRFRGSSSLFCEGEMSPLEDPWLVSLSCLRLSCYQISRFRNRKGKQTFSSTSSTLLSSFMLASHKESSIYYSILERWRRKLGKNWGLNSAYSERRLGCNKELKEAHPRAV